MTGTEAPPFQTRRRIVDGHDLLVMNGTGRMSAIDGEMHSLAADLVHQCHRGGPEPDAIKGWQQTQVGFQWVDLETWSVSQHPREEGAWLIRAGKRLGAPFECHPGVEIPTEQHDSVPGAQHRRLEVSDVISPIDDAGELIGTRHAPARLAESQQSIVAHTQSQQARLSTDVAQYLPH
jgi:hypothetical protein